MQMTSQKGVSTWCIETGEIAKQNSSGRMSKAKEKRQQRKQEQAKIGASKALVTAAMKQEDPMANLKPFQIFNRNGLSLTITCQLATKLTPEENEWAFDLTKNNMKTMYDESEIKWKDRDKREELTDETAWYLIAHNENRSPVAFAHFRYDLDNDVEVIYCYEIQLEKGFRRKGLGKFMMQILELLAFQSEMKKVVLTVFKHNFQALEFFVKVLKYEIDETSPSLCDDEDDCDCTYEILSKNIKPKKR